MHEFYTTYKDGVPQLKKGELDPYIRLILNKNRTRHGKLSDIISSIQSEQNQIIRKNPSANFVVQGCAGSGKTQILIHRLAYLQGRKLLDGVEPVYILTPNRQFNDYILSVQESLGINPDVIHTSSVEDYYIHLTNSCFNASGVNLQLVYQPDSSSIALKHSPGNNSFNKASTDSHTSHEGDTDSSLNPDRIEINEEESHFSPALLQKVYSPAFYQETEDLVFNLWDSIMQAYPLPFAVFDAGFEPGYSALAKIESQLEETLRSIREANPDLLQKLEEAPKKIPILESRLKKAVSERTKAGFVFQKRLEAIRQFLEAGNFSEMNDSGSSSARKETGKTLNKLLAPEEKAIQKQIFTNHTALKKLFKKITDQSLKEDGAANNKSKEKASSALPVEPESSYLSIVKDLITESQSTLENSRKTLSELALDQLSLEKEKYTTALDQLRKQIADSIRETGFAEENTEHSIQTPAPALASSETETQKPESQKSASRKPGSQKLEARKKKASDRVLTMSLAEIEKEEAVFKPLLEERWNRIERMVQLRAIRNNPFDLLENLTNPVFFEASPESALNLDSASVKGPVLSVNRIPDSDISRPNPQQPHASAEGTEKGSKICLEKEQESSHPVKTLLASILNQLNFLEALFQDGNPNRHFKTLMQSFHVLVPVFQYLELEEVLDRTSSIQSELEDLLNTSQGMSSLCGLDFDLKEMRKQLNQIRKIWNWPKLFQLLLLNRLPAALQDSFDTEWLNHPNEPCLMHIHYRHQLYLTLMLAAQLLSKPVLSQSMLNIDEAQDLSLPEYMLLQKIHSSDCIFNLYGDENQNIYEYRGIDSWNSLDEVFSLEKISVENNYRNPVQVTSFCNREFKTHIHEIGISDPAYKVRTIKSLSKALELFAGTLLNKPESSFAIICKDQKTKTQLSLLLNQETQKHNDPNDPSAKNNSDSLRTLSQSGSLPLYTVKEAKGLEFQYVLALTDGMSRNEKYVSYTRALQQLFVCPVPNLIQNAQEIWAKSQPADYTEGFISKPGRDLPSALNPITSPVPLDSSANLSTSASVLHCADDKVSNDPVRSQWPEFTMPELMEEHNVDPDHSHPENMGSEEAESHQQNASQISEVKDIAVLIQTIQSQELEKLETEYALQKAEEERRKAERKALEQERKEARRLARIQKEKEQELERSRKETEQKEADSQESAKASHSIPDPFKFAADQDLVNSIQKDHNDHNNQNDQSPKRLPANPISSFDQTVFAAETQERMIEAARLAGIAAAKAALAEMNKTQPANSTEEVHQEVQQTIHPEIQQSFHHPLSIASAWAASPEPFHQNQSDPDCSDSNPSPDYELLLGRIDDLQSRLDSALQKLEAIESYKSTNIEEGHYPANSDSSLTTQESSDLLANETPNLAPLPNPEPKDALPGFTSKNRIPDQILEKIDQSIEQAIPKAVDAALNSAVNSLTSSIAESVNEAIALSLESKANSAIQHQLTRFVYQITMTINDQITKTMTDIQDELEHFIHQYDKRLSESLNKLDSRLARSDTSIVEKTPVIESVNQQANQKIIQNQNTDEQRVNTKPLAFGEEPSAIPASVNKSNNDSSTSSTSSTSNLTSNTAASSNQPSLKTEIPVEKLLKMTRIDKNIKVSAGDPVHHYLYGNGTVVKTKLTKYQVRFVVNNSEQIIDLPKYGSNLYLLEE